ncbi:MAG TPA: SDR family oxidoreductase [Candidatus Marinimicrobia bacterium]|nr:SDR family oxidoreductase [Candidatus Neomarinimicrobiota bacterium]
MIKIGITGQSGFIGSHLYNYLGLKKDITRIPFEDDFFSSVTKLKGFVRQCDAIVHLAAMNRHEDEQVLYKTNIELVKKLIQACEETGSASHILFASSIQEEKDNIYGRSKREGRILFEEWARKNNTRFTGMIIPNVFGPFGQPFYNSVVATFCYQLTHHETPEIIVDGNLKLIYINELVEEICRQIIASPNEDPISRYSVPYSYENKVSYILSILTEYKETYLRKGTIPPLSTPFEIALFNTFRCYIPETHYPLVYSKHDDERGSFVEILKTNTPGQFSFSTTRPGITRGNHFHIRKLERFAVIRGRAIIQLRRIGTDRIIEYPVDGKKPSFIDIPVWHTHHITNTGNDELLTLFWTNEFYNPEDTDTYFEMV